MKKTASFISFNYELDINTINVSFIYVYYI